ncbi:MAG: hypothetical protein NVSMB60_11900 [Mycobacterium sp.]
MFQRQRQSTLRLVAGVAVPLAGAGILSLGAPPAATAAATPDQVASQILDNIVQGDDAAASAQFDQTMQAMLPVKALGQAWTTYQQALGAYQSHGAPQDVQRGDLTVVNVPLQMEHQPGQFRLTVHPDGTIAGLYFLKEGIPVP